MLDSVKLARRALMGAVRDSELDDTASAIFLPVDSAKLSSYFPSSYKYSTNDITAPSKPWMFGFVDSMT